MEISLLTCGGTIDKVYGSGHAVRDLHIGQPYAPVFLQGQTGNTFQIKHTELMRKDSLDMRDSDRQIIVESFKTASSQIIITHGSDSMLETAEAIYSSGAGTNRTVVLTGSLLPAVMQKSDADFQLGLALAACTLRGSGIFIAMNGVFDWRACKKDERTGQFVRS